MKAIIKLDVPDWQIGQDVTVYFPDTMMKKGECEAEQDIVMCKDCKYLLEHDSREWQCEIKFGWFPVKPDWFCADGEKR